MNDSCSTIAVEALARRRRGRRLRGVRVREPERLAARLDRAPSRCAARGRRAAAPRGPGTRPSPATPPSSSLSSSASWRPRQMPRIGPPAAARSRSAVSRPRAAQARHRGRRRADARAGPRGRRRARRRRPRRSPPSAPRRSNASCTERTLPAPYAQIATFTAGPSSTELGAVAPHRIAQRAPDRLARGLGDVMRIAAGRAHVQRHARRLREALERVAREARILLEVDLGAAPAAEVDGRAGERVVHRHDRRAVARDPAPVAERAVDRLAERDRRVLGGVMRRRSPSRRCRRRRGRGRRGTRAARSRWS